MKIISLTAENVKKLVAVEIKPNGNVVQITGKNGQGKSSVLDAIWWCLAGASVIQAEPIRKGQERAKIRLDLGEYIVTRTFTRKDKNEFTTQIAVDAADGARHKGPQAVIDELLGSLSFDPLAFDRMKPKDKFDALRKFVPGIDFDKVDAQNRGDFERRTDANRLARESRAAANMIIVPDGIPDEPLNEQALVAKLQEAGDQNADTERRRARREQMATDAKQERDKAAAARGRIESEQAEVIARHERAIADIDRQIAELQKRREAQKEESGAEFENVAINRNAEAAAAIAIAEEIEGKLANADALPPIIDTVELSMQINKARETNQAVEQARKRKVHEATAEKYEAEAKGLTESIDARNKAKRDAIAAAKMPIPGLDFGDGAVLLNGVPFEQGSDAERLRASVAIAMAANPKLRVIRIRDGSLLDEDAMKLLSEMADAQDMQVWVERVDSSGAVGFVLENGMVKSPAKSDEEAAA